MQIITNKMFEEIFVGDTTSVQHTLQRGDLRAWAAAFGDADMLQPSRKPGAAGIFTGYWPRSSLRLSRPGSLIVATSVSSRASCRSASDDVAPRRERKVADQGSSCWTVNAPAHRRDRGDGDVASAAP